MGLALSRFAISPQPAQWQFRPRAVRVTFVKVQAVGDTPADKRAVEVVMDRNAVRRFAARREVLGLASDLAELVLSLVQNIFDTYRPELHYMRGPGPGWQARHHRRPWSDLEVVQGGRCQSSQRYVFGPPFR